MPLPKNSTTKPLFDDSQEELVLVNNLRTLVARWRQQAYPEVTNATKRLLDHWNSDQPEPRLFFAQREAIETLIYLYEIAPAGQGVAYRLARVYEAQPDALRYAHSSMALRTLGTLRRMSASRLWPYIAFPAWHGRDIGLHGGSPSAFAI